MNRSLARMPITLLAFLLVFGCTAPVARKPAAPTFTPIWFGKQPPQQTKGYTINGLSVGGTLAELQASVGDPYTVEKVDWRYQVSDPSSQAKVLVTVDDADKVVTLWTNSNGSLEKDGASVLRTRESEDVALKALGLPPGSKTPWMIGEGRSSVVVDGGPSVYSVSLWDEAFRQAALKPTGQPR